VAKNAFVDDSADWTERGPLVPMKILFLVHRIPYPPNKGEKIRAFQELKFLAARHSIDLFCFADSAEEADQQWYLRDLCRRIYVETRGPISAKLRMARSLWRGEPLSNGYFYSARFRKEIRSALAAERYDLIFVYCSSMAQYLPKPAPAPVVVDFVDVDSAKWAQYARTSRFPMSWLYSREARLMAKSEEEAARTASVSIVTTGQEALLLDPERKHRVEVIGNGVARPTVSIDAHLSEPIVKLQPYVLFVGQMDYRPNIDAVTYFVDKIFPYIRDKYPEVRFVIAGRNPTSKVKRLAARRGVVVTGAVPDVHPYLMGSSVVVAPFRISQGVQNKILEALAVGKPVVSTSRPAEAINAVHGETLLIADSPEEFAQCVSNLLGSSELRGRFARASEFVRQKFDWQTSLARLESLCEQSARQRREWKSGDSGRVEAN
jgi:sugar transferase (PEP-CTERM/EpsH1 system associated)